MKIAIIDYGMGNLFSVKNACKYVGLDPIVTSDASVILHADGVILPGVGAFAKAMVNLQELNLVEPIKLFIKSCKPFMGICLGMQLLFSESEEFENSVGLDIIEGKVRKFPATTIDEETIKVPQIGWNKILKTSLDSEHISPLNNIKNKEFMYFIHSYYVDPFEDNIVLTTTQYGDINYCSSVLKANIFAAQFHPEKSADKGIEIYRNWAKMIQNSNS